MALHTRRRFLATAGSIGIGSVAGCTGQSVLRAPFGGWTDTAETTTDPLPDETTDWAQFGRTPGRTGYAPDVELDDPSVDWTLGLSGSMAPPVVVGDRVFVHGGVESKSGSRIFDPIVLSLDSSDGSQRWRRDLPASGGGYSGSPPVVYRGSVYVGNAGENGLFAIDARDGRPRWRHRTRNSVNEAALGVGDQVVASTGDVLLGFDERGTERWRYETGDDRSSFAPPAAGDGLVLYTTGVIGTVVALGGQASGGLSEWRYQADTSFGTPTVSDGTVYVPGSDRVHAIDLATGDRRWTAPVAASAGIATDGDRLYVPSQSGDLVALSTTDGSERWRRTLVVQDGTYLRTRPLVTRRSVIVTTEKPQVDERVTTFATDRETGERRWFVDQPGNVGFDAVAAGGRVYVPVYWSVGDEGGTLVALSG